MRRLGDTVFLQLVGRHEDILISVLLCYFALFGFEVENKTALTFYRLLKLTAGCARRRYIHGAILRCAPSVGTESPVA